MHTKKPETQTQKIINCLGLLGLSLLLTFLTHQCQPKQSASATATKIQNTR